ncbi:RNA polymerase sigma factor [Aliidiomarina soli]|uniref:RNA polymerase subunit sigma-70 n=1 Tax=Aliidiomarina soli TaxID=1928574 RepID=A0A432WGZ0_9GAMM|nr:RNA polymerase sigma factor [Aliidiomarina soli]RUO33096.1 RNA polymerase subunit sigma-70 [Aliidiomarina soli]
MTNSEKGLIQHAQAGDKAAFRQLYESYVGRVYAICRRLCSDRGRAEEATQEVFIKVWRQLPEFSFNSQFTTWLHSIAKRTAIDMWRREQVRLVEVGDEHESEATAEGAFDNELERAIQRLPAQSKAVFVLVAIEGHTHREVAELLHIAEGSSKSHYFRARQLLKEALSHES